MKTILYQPIFINPQAYFVFPQLYHIEKGDSLGGEYYMITHSNDYTVENSLIKSTDNTFLVSIENANEKDVKAMLIDMYYDSTVPGSYLNGEYTEGSVKLTNRRIMGINNPTTTTAGEGNVYLIIGDRQYDVISGQPQTYSVSGAVKLDFLNMEEVANFAGTIKFTNVV